MIPSYSRAAQVAYQDLPRLHLDEAASELVGSVERIKASLARMPDTAEVLRGLG